MRRTATMTMNSNQDNRQPPPSYADEVLCANWHPLVLLLAEPLARAQKTALNAVEAEDFLTRLYSCQRA
jgi:hypothetical protein